MVKIKMVVAKGLMMKVYDCADFYFFGSYLKHEVENILEDELGLKVVVQEISWEEYGKVEARGRTKEVVERAEIKAEG